MELSDQLLCMFSGRVERTNGSYVVEIPEGELQLGELQENRTYRVAVFPGLAEGESGQTESRGNSKRDRSMPDPPVSEGETREVDIEDIGDQGDGITRVERGYVVIVPDTEQGERVTVEITDVQENVAFAEVIERQTHF